MPLNVALQLAPTVQAAGTVREIAPAADPVTRTRRVRLELKTPSSAFRIGTTVTATWSRAIAPFIALPRTAVFQNTGQNRVWVVDPKTHALASRPIELGQGDAQTVRITGGLASDDLVVTAGANSLTEGESVALPGETPK